MTRLGKVIHNWMNFFRSFGDHHLARIKARAEQKKKG